MGGCGLFVVPCSFFPAFYVGIWIFWSAGEDLFRVFCFRFRFRFRVGCVWLCLCLFVGLWVCGFVGLLVCGFVCDTYR